MKTVYAIPNCNTVKKALDWLNKNKVAVEFHDYKKKGITAAQLTHWSKQIGWETLINKKGATTIIEIDGGVTNKNAVQLVQAGADVLVAGNYVFKAENPTQTIADLKKMTTI